MNRPAPRIGAAALATSLATALLLVLAGCGDDEENGTAAQDPTPVPAATSQATSSASASVDADPSESPTAAGQTIEINLEDGKPTEKVGPTVTVAKGDKLTLVITSDSDQEIHVHGLDEYVEIPAGETVTKTFTIDLAKGSYEVEVHDTEIVLFNLQVK